MAVLRFIAAVLLGLLAFGARAEAQNIIEQLVNPGPLAAAHAKLEATCNDCHTPFTRETQNALCLSCHKPVGADVAAHTGFHGRSPEVGSSQCRRCHTDHKGRDASIVFFSPSLFDHDISEFKLTGGHVGIACASCHKPMAKFRDAPVACDACHVKDDVHKGELGDKCRDCHAAETWRKTTVKFDHGKTKFALTGAHAKAECRSCHAGAAYIGLPLTCIGCHKADDVHKGSLGAKCQDCHVTEVWSTVTFDHDKTRFPLHGAHRKSACNGCHSPNPIEDKGKLPLTCIGCHQKDDVHKGSFGPQCQSCHNEINWKQATNFDHDKTRFPLVGKHKPVPCADCHKSKDFKQTPMLCQDCHKDTFHKGRLGPECASCHTPKGWLLWRFDHNKQTKFPLTGRHIGLDCHSCHSKPVSGKPVLDTVCGSCHHKDDVHRGSFGQNCGRCHSTSTFRR